MKFSLKGLIAIVTMFCVGLVGGHVGRNGEIHELQRDITRRETELLLDRQSVYNSVLLHRKRVKQLDLVISEFVACQSCGTRGTDSKVQSVEQSNATDVYLCESCRHESIRTLNYSVTGKPEHPISYFRPNGIGNIEAAMPPTKQR